VYYNESDRTQPTRRRNYNVKDQWGRKWLVSIEKETGHPTGAIEACFTDPLATPQQYLEIDEEMPRQLTIRYDRWIADQNAAMRDWEARRDDIGRALYGERYNPAKKITRELERIVGKQPRSVGDIERAAAGDKTLLGLVPDAKGSTVLTDVRAKPKKVKAKAAEPGKKVVSPKVLASLERARAARKAKATQA